jgi:hypothetical protein
VHREAKAPVKRMLRLLHKAEEIRKMDDAGHVGIGKLNPASVQKAVGWSLGHGGD